MKQDLRQVLLNPHGRDPHLPWGSCGEISAHPTDQCTPALLKLIVGTKAFHVNLMSTAALNLRSLQKVAFGFADS